MATERRSDPRVPVALLGTASFASFAPPQTLSHGDRVTLHLAFLALRALAYGALMLFIRLFLGSQFVLRLRARKCIPTNDRALQCCLKSCYTPWETGKMLGRCLLRAQMWMDVYGNAWLVLVIILCC